MFFVLDSFTGHERTNEKGKISAKRLKIAQTWDTVLRSKQEDLTRSLVCKTGIWMLLIRRRPVNFGLLCSQANTEPGDLVVLLVCLICTLSRFVSLWTCPRGIRSET